MRNPLRSVVAIVVGFLVIGALAFGTDALLHAAWPDAFNSASLMTASVGILLFTLLYVAVYAIFGCYLAAILAPERELARGMGGRCR